ncbi:MAG: cytochrome c oxidase subunit II [Deltaproteobacteria bacterium]|nr:MAG: cytochrome c oxidase subunit II [Deltaproteobacteria bacterium]
MRRLHWILGPAFAAVLATMPVANVKAQEKVIQVTAERFKFTPSVIELKLGEPVILELTTLDRKHGFQVSDLNIDETVEPGKVTHIRIVPAKAGTFLFHCTVFCGSGHEDMAGEIVVKP